MRWHDARLALVRERLSPRAAEAALLLSAEEGSVRVGASLRVTHYGGGDYEVRRAYQADAGGDAAVRDDSDVTGAYGRLRLIQGGQS